MAKGYYAIRNAKAIAETGLTYNQLRGIAERSDKSAAKVRKELRKAPKELNRKVHRQTIKSRRELRSAKGGVQRNAAKQRARKAFESLMADQPAADQEWKASRIGWYH